MRVDPQCPGYGLSVCVLQVKLLDIELPVCVLTLSVQLRNATTTTNDLPAYVLQVKLLLDIELPVCVDPQECPDNDLPLCACCR